MHEKVLPRGSRRLLDLLDRPPAPLSGWILAGGTGLALHLGHRVSDDFDFFRTEQTDFAALRGVLAACGAGELETLQSEEHTLTVLASGVKLSFFRVRDSFLCKPVAHRTFAVADPWDIGLMKLAAISSRGSRKDFVDLYFILHNGPRLADLFRDLPRKYGAQRTEAYHVLKSLTWFEDAEREPLPRMLEPFRWEECKSFFLREAHAIVLR